MLVITDNFHKLFVLVTQTFSDSSPEEVSPPMGMAVYCMNFKQRVLNFCLSSITGSRAG